MPSTLSNMASGKQIQLMLDMRPTMWSSLVAVAMRTAKKNGENISLILHEMNYLSGMVKNKTSSFTKVRFF